MAALISATPPPLSPENSGYAPVLSPVLLFFPRLLTHAYFASPVVRLTTTRFDISSPLISSTQPANILCDEALQQQQLSGTIKIADFGCAVRDGGVDRAGLTMTSNMGTPAYMAPELVADSKRTQRILCACAAPLDLQTAGLVPSHDTCRDGAIT